MFLFYWNQQIWNRPQTNSFWINSTSSELNEKNIFFCYFPPIERQTFRFVQSIGPTHFSVSCTVHLFSTWPNTVFYQRNWTTPNHDITDKPSEYTPIRILAQRKKELRLYFYRALLRNRTSVASLQPKFQVVEKLQIQKFLSVNKRFTN